MGEKYNQSKISTQLRETTKIANLVKTIEFLFQIYKIGMIQCAQLGYCPIRGMKWSITGIMIEMNQPTCYRLFRKFCGDFWRGLYGKKKSS